MATQKENHNGDLPRYRYGGKATNFDILGSHLAVGYTLLLLVLPQAL